MRYTDKQGNTLNLDECMTADSFLMEADNYIDEPLEMHFDLTGELKAGKKGKQAAAPLRSNGSELIPAEAQAYKRSNSTQLLEVPVGRTVDNEGLNNNYAIQPAMSLAEYPSSEQQKRYAFQGAIAIVFVALTLLTVFVVS
jgi:hypothetical protein